MDSTFKLNRSMRESAEKIDAFCQSTVTGNFFSIDRQAIRLWSSDKQIKAVHFTEAEYNPEVIGLEHLPRIDGFAAYLQSGKSSHKFFSTFKVWSSSLQALYQVSISSHNSSMQKYDRENDNVHVKTREEYVHYLVHTIGSHSIATKHCQTEYS